MKNYVKYSKYITTERNLYLNSIFFCIPNTNINLHKQSNNNNTQSKIRYYTNRYSDLTKFKRIQKI